jgi:hypothetical protein
MTHEGDPAGDRRGERLTVAVLLCALVLARSLVFLVWPLSHFDADQAVFGLMAKHLSELRAFPVFMYGQSYILATEAWLAAPLFALLGVSATVLTLPLLAVNLAVVLLLLRLLERDAGLRPLVAAVPILFFALPAPVTASHFLHASGGNVEPFLYVLLLWITRHRPNVGGIVLGFAFLHREFSIYGLVALLAIEAANRSLFTRAGIVHRLKMLRTAAEVWIGVQFLSRYASAAGPGTSVADLYAAPNNLAELMNRTCLDPRTVTDGGRLLFTSHWPLLFGTAPVPLAESAIETTAWQGVPGAWLLFAITFALALAGALTGLLRTRRWLPEWTFPAYLILVGLLSVAGYIFGRCGVVDPKTMRYELLSVMGAAGLGALYLVVTAGPRLRRTWIALALACAAVAASGHARLAADYVVQRPVGPKEMLVRHLQARGIKYGYADYWVAYYVSFVTREQVVLAANDFVRIKTYEPIVAAHAETAVRVARQGCEGGRRLTEFFYLCPP